MRSLFSLTALLALLATPAAAQQWSVEAHAGQIRSALDPATSALQNVLLGVRYDAPTSAFRLSVGVPTAATEPLSAAIAGARRLQLRSGAFVGGVDLSAHGILLHDRNEQGSGPGGLFDPPDPLTANLSGQAFAGQVLPFVGFETRRLQLHARAGVSHYTGEFAGQQRNRTVGLADVQLKIAPTSSFALIPTLQRFQDQEAAFTYAGIGGVAGNEHASVWGSAGRWLDIEGVTAPQWSAGAALQLHKRVTASVSGRRDVFDALYLNPAATSWSVGVSVALSSKPALAAPVPAAYEDGRATIRLPASQSTGAPRIAGDFNNWKPAPMQRSGADWTYIIAVRPGVYQYAFVNESDEWFVPTQHPGRKDDGMGGHVAVLVVQ